MRLRKPDFVGSYYCLSYHQYLGYNIFTLTILKVIKVWLVQGHTLGFEPCLFASKVPHLSTRSIGPWLWLMDSAGQSPWPDSQVPLWVKRIIIRELLMGVKGTQPEEDVCSGKSPFLNSSQTACETMERTDEESQISLACYWLSTCALKSHNGDNIKTWGWDMR